MLATNTEITTDVITAESKKFPEGTQTCLHCRLPSNDHPFCCIGCESIYKTIHELGLEHFYDLQFEAGKPPAPIAEKETLAALDLPELLSKYFTKTDESLLQGTLILEGIHCVGCVWMLEKLSAITPGIKSSRVDMGQGLLRITFDPKVTKLSIIAAAVNQLGYSVTISKTASSANHSDLIRLGVAAICAANTMMLAVSLWQGLFTKMALQYSYLFLIASFTLTIPCITYAALPFYRNALFSLRHGRFHIDLPLSIALIGAFVASSINMTLGKNTVYFDSICLLTFLLLAGRYIQSRALSKAQTRTKTACSVLPSSARIVQNHTFQTVATDSILPGTIIEVRTGERVPVDGTIALGTAYVDRSILTGESQPVPITIGDHIEASSQIVSGVVQIMSESLPLNSRMHQILTTLDSVPDSQLRILSLTERLSFWFVVVVLSGAVVTFWYWSQYSMFTAIDNTVALLIVSCPCALGIAMPLIIARANSELAAIGILVKKSSALESLVLSKKVYIDKTGTITSGQLELLRNDAALTQDCQDVLATLIYYSSRHPITEALKKNISPLRTPIVDSSLIITTVGKGVSLTDQHGDQYFLGSTDWFSALGGILHTTKPQLKDDQSIGSSSLFWVIPAELQSKMPVLLEEFLFTDVIRPNVQNFLSTLKNNSYTPIVLSGDSQINCERVQNKLHLSKESVFASRSPEEKAFLIRNDPLDTIMIGDGINDSLALKAATVGIGFKGSLEASADSCDIYMQTPSFEQLQIMFTYARQIRKLVLTTIYVGTGYNLIFAPLAILGFINPVIAAFVMPLSSISVIGISLYGTSIPGKK